MPLPTNTQSTAGQSNALGGTGVRNIIQVNKPAPIQYTPGQNVIDLSGADPSAFNGNNFTNNTGNSSGSGSYQFGITGKPRINGIEKALGVLGAGIALIQTAANLVSIGKGILGTLEGLAAQAKALGDTLGTAVRGIFQNALTTVESPLEYQFVSVLPQKEDWRVSIRVKSTGSSIISDAFGDAGYLRSLKDHRGVVFPYTPSISVNYKANYNAVSPVHSNFDVHAYKNSGIDDIQISGNFTVSNQEEGEYYLAATRFLRSLTKSFYGSSIPQGQPPLVAQLYGYGGYVFGSSTGGINIVVKSVNIELPRNVQYMRILDVKDEPNWVPLDSTITVTCTPIYNRARLRNFSHADYLNGGQKGIL